MTLEKETSIYQLGAIAADIERSIDIAASKNSIFHQPTAPSTSGRKVGDIWYDSDDGYAMHKFDGTEWVREQFGTNAISAGSITAARLDAQDVYTNFLRVNFLAAAQAEIESLSAITANLGSVNVGGVNNEDGVIQVLDAAGNPIGYWNNTGINAQAGVIGPWTIGSSGIYNGKTGIGDNTNGVFVGTAGIEYETADGRVTFYPDRGVQVKAKTVLGTEYGFDVKGLDGKGTKLSHYGIDGYRVINNTNHQGFRLEYLTDSGGLVYGQLRLGGYDVPKFIEITSGVPQITIGANSDVGILRYYNTTTEDVYNIIRSHNNGNISVSASSAGLYLGYENTTQINFLNGKAAMDANGNFTALGNITSAKTSGQAAVYASNGASKNRIFIYADSSNGQAGLYSYSADNTPRAILVRENNSSVINTYGDWVFTNVIPWKTDIKGRPMISDSANGNRVSLLTSGASGRVGIQAQFGSTGTTYSIGYFNVAASDIRLKKNIEDSTVDALSLVNAIKVRKFDWKDGRHQRIGMIADELEELDKALTIGGGYTDDNEMSIKSVDTFYLVGYLVKAVQELSAEIDRLKGAA